MQSSPLTMKKKLPENYIQIIAEESAANSTKVQCAKKLGIHRETLNKYLRDNAEAQNAWAEGRNKPKEHVKKLPRKYVKMNGEVGRPKDVFTPAELRLARESARIGLTRDLIAHVLGISTRNLMYRMKEDQELSAAIHEGQTLAYMEIARSAHELAVKDKNHSMLIFLLKTRFGYRDVAQIEHTGRGGGPIRIVHENDLSSPEEIAATWNEVKDGLAIFQPEDED